MFIVPITDGKYDTDIQNKIITCKQLQAAGEWCTGGNVASLLDKVKIRFEIKRKMKHQSSQMYTVKQYKPLLYNHFAVDGRK